METRSRLLRRSWLLGAFAALLLTGACAELQDAFGGEESTPAPEATAVPDATAGEAAGSAAALEPTADAELAMRYIGNTGGVGVSLRSACAADARSPGGWPEATEVRLLDSDEAGCEGWSLAEAGGATSWVSELYLVQERPAGATIGSSAPAPPAGAASGAGGNAAAAAATPPPAAAGSAMSGAAPMIVYGPAAAGASVLILIDGRPCKTVEAVAEPSSATGLLWSTQVHAVECDARAGSAITFALEGAPTNERLEWSAGGVPPNVATGVSLTLR